MDIPLDFARKFLLQHFCRCFTMVFRLVKRWRLHILPQQQVNLTQPIKYKESHIFAILSYLARLYMQLN